MAKKRKVTNCINYLCICMGMLMVISILSLAVIFVLPPRPKFGLNSLYVSKFNIFSASEITANWDVNFSATNPNHERSFTYDHVVLSVLYKNQLVSEEAVVPMIHLQRRETKSYTAKAFAMAKRMEDCQVAEALARDLSEGGVVGFTVRLVESNMNMGRYHHVTDLNVTCADVMVEFKANHDEGDYDGTMILLPPNTNTNSTSIDQQQEAYARCSSHAT